MRSIPIISTSLILAVSGPLLTQALAQEWIEFASREDRFTCNFPTQPKITESIYRSQHEADLPARIYSATQGQSRYSVTVVDFFDGPKADVTIVEHASANLKARGTLFHEDFATYDPGMPGHQLNIFETKERQIRASVYMAEHRLYITEATIAVGDIPAVQFEQSITLVDEMGWDLDREAPNGEPSPRQFKCR